MSTTLIKPAKPLKGKLKIPGDKSISHRAIMLGSIAKGDTVIFNFLESEDCHSTISCFRQLGILIEREDDKLIVHGKGLHGLTNPRRILNTGNSGTTTRLLTGILAGQPFPSVICGDESLNKRPMKRIIDPLTHMGAKIRSTYGNGCAPLEIDSSELHGINYVSPIASAQVQSAVLFAGLYATGDTTISEPFLSRDHTRIMLNHFEANVRHSSTADKATGQARYSTTISPVEEIYGRTVCVPGDISSAAFFIAAALLVPGSVLQIENVGVNPTRDGLLRVLETMGADITILDYNDNNGEPTATIYVRYSKLHGTTISGALIPALIDELPIIAVLAATAVGTTIIKDAAELKVKESNRIHTVVTNLTALGANVTETDDGMVIEGVDQLSGGTIGSFMDHRIAMAFAIGGLAAREPVRILNSQCVDISFPTFFKSRIFK